MEFPDFPVLIRRTQKDRAISIEFLFAFVANWLNRHMIKACLNIFPKLYGTKAYSDRHFFGHPYMLDENKMVVEVGYSG